MRTPTNIRTVILGIIIGLSLIAIITFSYLFIFQKSNKNKLDNNPDQFTLSGLTPSVDNEIDVDQPSEVIDSIISTEDWTIYLNNSKVDPIGKGDKVIVIPEGSKEIVTKTLSGEVVSKFTLPEACTVETNSAIYFQTNNPYAKIYCTDGFTYFFNHERIVFKTNLLDDSAVSLLSEDMQYLVYKNRTDENSDMVIVNLKNNLTKRFGFDSQTNGVVIEKPTSSVSEFFKSLSNLTKVSADCGHYGPYPKYFDSSIENLYVESVCIDGIGVIYRIDLSDFTVNKTNISNLSKLITSVDGEEYLYRYSEIDSYTGKNRDSKISMFDRLTGQLIKTIKIDTPIRSDSPDWGYPVIDVTSDGKFLLLNSFLFQCYTADSSECDDTLEKLVIFDLKNSKTIAEIKKAEPYNQMYRYLYSDNSQIIYQEKHNGNSKIMSFDITTQTVSTVYLVPEGERILWVN